MNLNLHFSFIFCTVLAQFFSASSAKFFSVDGFVSHGVNTFNSRPIVDFSKASNIFSAAGIVHEIGVKNLGGNNGSRINAATPKSARMVTIDATQFQDAFGFPAGVGPFNVPIAKTPTIFVGSKNINDRVKPRSFAETALPENIGSPYISAHADADIRLREWNRARASIRGRCRKDGTAFVIISIYNGLPNGLYTLWDIGVLNAMTKEESVSLSPFGGLPNVIATDRFGWGRVSRKLLYCPLVKCGKSKRCTLYVSLFYHFDHMVYAGTAAMDDAGPAGGNVGSNHVQIFFNGEVLKPRKW